MGYRSGKFSVERLMDFLIALGPDVEITVRPTRKQRCQVSIVLAGSSPRGSWLEDAIIVDWSKPELGYDPVLAV
jgi:hypothetical protein